MNTFLKLVDLNGDCMHVNPRCIVSIRPANRTSFRDSGAEIKVTDGIETKTHFTEPGVTTDTVVSWLGVEGY